MLVLPRRENEEKTRRLLLCYDRELDRGLHLAVQLGRSLVLADVLDRLDRNRLAIQLDAFGCHTVGGIVGGILTGLFCVPELSWTDFGGLFYTGDPSLLVSQILGILVTIAFVIVGGLILGFIVKAVYKGKARVSEEDEAAGLDVALHGESAYPAYLGLD